MQNDVGQTDSSGMTVPALILDITQTVNISSSEAVCEAVHAIYRKRFPKGPSFDVIERIFADVDQMYHGTYPGFVACDTDYHDQRHILDVTLAMARLVDGHEARHEGSADALGAERMLIGIVGALFHDIGYIRYARDTRHKHGAEYTKTHVTRGIKLIKRYLPTIGRPEWVKCLAGILHYTGYEKPPATLSMPDPLDHMLGRLLGSADLIAQMSDRAYLERCRDCLFTEFTIGNIPAPFDADKRPFESPTAMLNQTPDFMRKTIESRLDALFGSVYEYACDHFDGENFYMSGVRKNCEFLENLIRNKDLDSLRRRSLS